MYLHEVCHQMIFYTCEMETMMQKTRPCFPAPSGGVTLLIPDARIAEWAQEVMNLQSKQHTDWIHNA